MVLIVVRYITFPNCSIRSMLVSLALRCSAAQQQKFRLTPVDLVVAEGAEALLRCEIHNAAGSVQWTKDGFALGFTQSIPGYPRYSVLGDSGQGIYNLRIVNVTLDDDAEYQCQVGPYMHHTLIRAKAKLTVIALTHPCQMVLISKCQSDNSNITQKESGREN
uniref:Ig-like domain-containing protein n=1 Tax=Anopheles farauti TaxID=69004 RepID=A0A182QLS3_9DIPT